MNDLEGLVDCKILLFADDVKLFFVVSSESDSDLLEGEFLKLQVWSMSNGLPVNPS